MTQHDVEEEGKYTRHCTCVVCEKHQKLEKQTKA